MWHEAKHGLGSGWIRYRRKRREVKAKMAHTCVAFNSLIFSSNPTSSSDSHKLSFSSRKFTKLVGSEKRLRVAPVKAAYSGEFWAPDKNSRQGIWSVRDDLQIPSSAYFPTYAQGGQGPPPMVQERFQSVVSQLFQHRIIRCGGAVDDDMANIIVAQLLYLDAVDPDKVRIVA
ncbi:ATP-dependent Clp protease proteolytic subunit 5, chloroplastic [Vitis vinifera]|uniref:ATP-dependent Clp protease proteolytic subunit 5, chloroplastic n=1 Tax=Vitis vinifera TaxID=29760 RepID=A0A438E1E6_VITVI|nr:ATP-dependent Clp protease proteolytic subunit 5, chloroplastic [Vitis vinifera]